MTALDQEQGTEDLTGFLGVDAELGDTPAEPAPPIAAGEGSALSSLRARRAKAAEGLVFDLEVPRMEGPVYVRYRPVVQKRIEQIYARVGKMRTDDKTVIANAIILADVCQGVFEIIDGQQVSIDPEDRDGEWPTFGPRLAELLGVRCGKAHEVVRALYLTDGDIISTAQDLNVKSGYAQDQLERDAEGN